MGRGGLTCERRDNSEPGETIAHPADAAEMFQDFNPGDFFPPSPPKTQVSQRPSCGRCR